MLPLTMFCISFLLLVVPTSSRRRIGRLNVRKSASELTREERSALVDAILALKHTPSQYNPSYNAYDYFTYLHDIRSDPFSKFSAHLSTRFFPWHREFTFRFNQELKRVSGDPTMEMPYWNPSSISDYEVLLEDLEFIGGNGFPVQEGRLACGKFPVSLVDVGNNSCLNRAINSPLIAKKGNLTKVYGEIRPYGFYEDLIAKGLPLDVPPYTAFNFTGPDYLNSFVAQVDGCDPRDPIPISSLWLVGACVENHGSMHTHVGGNLASRGSPNDPLFFAVHSFIDLVWALYQDEFGDDTVPESFIDGLIDDTWPDVTFRTTLDHRCSYGYRYDIQRRRREAPTLTRSRNCVRLPPRRRPKKRIPEFDEHKALQCVSELHRHISFALEKSTTALFEEYVRNNFCEKILGSSYLGAMDANFTSSKDFGNVKKGFIPSTLKAIGRPNLLYFHSSSTYFFDFANDAAVLQIGVRSVFVRLSGSTDARDGFYRFVFSYQDDHWCLKEYRQNVPKPHPQPIVLNV